MPHSRDLRRKPGIKRDFLQLPSSLEGEQCYCVTIPAGLDNKIVLITLLRQATYWFNWERSEGTEGKQAADRWSEVLNLPELEMCCCPGITNSYYDENGILWISTDGGLTYEQSTTDPRNSAPLLPPLEGVDGDTKRCEAANNVSGYISAMADQLIADAAAWNSLTALIAAVGAILVLLLSLGTAAALTPLILGLVAALVGTGSAAFEAAMTEGVISDLNCIVYCHTPNDGVYTESDWQAIKADVKSTYTGIVEKFIYDSINAMGLAGLTNASRAGVSSGQPCEECECVSCTSRENWQILQGTLVEETPTLIVIDSVDVGGGQHKVTYTSELSSTPGCCFAAYGLDSGVIQTTLYVNCEGAAAGAWPSTGVCGQGFSATNIFGQPFRIRIGFGDCP